ncbi:MAG: ZIP family metal transporter, partial [Nanoarchaeota archaeon]
VSIIFHEVPQEIADFGFLLYSGMSRARAIIFNLASALTAFLGLAAGLMLTRHIEGFSMYLLPFAAGNFIYIAASNLLPQLHRHCSIKDTLLHLMAVLIGVGIIIGISLLGPGHTHA